MSYERILGPLEGGTAIRPPPEFEEEDDIMSVFYPGFPSEDAEGKTTKALAAPRAKEGAPPPTITVAFDMTDYCRDTVRHYCNLVGKTARLKKASTPFCPDGTLPPKDDEIKGELGTNACSALMNGLWLCRLARPDAQKANQVLATHVHKWSKNDDKRIFRTMCYLWTHAITSSRATSQIGPTTCISCCTSTRTFVETLKTQSRQQERSSFCVVRTGPSFHLHGW